VNPDRALVLEFLRGGGAPLPLRSNPLGDELGGSILELDAERGAVVLAFLPHDRLVQGGGVLQGGIVTAMLDFAMAFAAHAVVADEAFSTATLHTNLLRPALPGRHIARGHLVRRGRKLLFAAAELATEDGKLVATGSSVMALAER